MANVDAGKDLLMISKKRNAKIFFILFILILIFALVFGLINEIIIAGIASIVLFAFLTFSANKYFRKFQELSQKKALFENIEKMFGALDTVIVITEVETDKTIFLNERMKKELGPNNDVIGKECWKYLTVEATKRCAYCPKNTLDPNSNEAVSWEFHSPITNKHYRIISRFIDWPDGTRVFMEQCDDITELKSVQEKLRLARDIAETANKAKSVFLANMSHEIRTPMNSIIGFSELAQDIENSPKTKEYLSKISKSAESLLMIINDILDISKIESGKMELESIPFDLHDIFAYCRTVILPKAEEKGLELYCAAEPAIGKKLVGDPIKLRQALLNILSNAIKFTDAGTVKLLACVKKEETDKNTIYFEIKDSGIGMSSEQVAKIFAPFTQADNSIARKFGGTGLGLAIAKNIIELMGGTLKVESAIDVGSKFSFELTFKVVDSVKAQPNKTVHFGIEKPNFKGEVLICEDNSMNQQVICEHLEKVGLKYVVAENGRDGFDIVAKRVWNDQKPFDLIFMDIHMPIMDGLEAATKIIELKVPTPIVAMTANVMPNDLEMYKKNGMPDALGKPFTSQELWKCLMKYFPLLGVFTIDKSQKAADEEKMLKHLKLNFAKSNQTIYADISQAFEDGDEKLAHRLAHTLKSNAGQIGEKKLQEAAAAVEAGGTHALPLLETELNSVLEKLTPLLNEQMSGELLSEEKIHELFEKLEVMLANKNPECMNLLGDIRKVQGTEDLARQIEEFEFERAEAELKLWRGY